MNIKTWPEASKKKEETMKDSRIGKPIGMRKKHELWKRGHIGKCKTGPAEVYGRNVRRCSASRDHYIQVPLHTSHWGLFL